MVPHCPGQAPMGACSSNPKIGGGPLQRRTCSITSWQAPTPNFLIYLDIGHVPAEISKVCCFFMRRGGTVKCTVSTNRHRRWLEVPCELIFVADDLDLLKKLKKIVSTPHINNYTTCLGLLRPTQS